MGLETNFDLVIVEFNRILPLTSLPMRMAPHRIIRSISSLKADSTVGRPVLRPLPNPPIFFSLQIFRNQLVSVQSSIEFVHVSELISQPHRYRRVDGAKRAATPNSHQRRGTRRIQVCPKDLRGAFGGSEPAIGWHTGFRGRSPCSTKAAPIHHAARQRSGRLVSRRARVAASDCSAPIQYP